MATTNYESQFLHKNENECIFSKLQKNTLTVCTCIIQLYLTQPPKHDTWTLFNTGVVCLTRDANRRSYYIQLYTFKDKFFIWEQEIYSEFTFKMSNDHFLTFEAENCMAGINFYSEEEAKEFNDILSDKLAKRETRRINRKQQLLQQQSYAISQQKTTTTSTSSTSSAPSVSSKKSKKVMMIAFGKNKKSKKTSKPSGLVISGPQDFRHITHVGYDPQKGFDLDNCDPAWSKLFNSLGLNKTALQDKQTSNFIYDFVQNNGGIENMVKEIDTMEKKKKPIPTLENSITKTPNKKNDVPPLPPKRKSFSQSPTDDDAPPPPPISPDVDVYENDSVSAEVPEPVPIQDSKPPKSQVKEVVSTGRDNLLSQITKGVALKKSSETLQSASEKKATSEDESDEDGMVGILAKRLAAMRANVAEGGSDDESEDNWDD